MYTIHQLQIKQFIGFLILLFAFPGCTEKISQVIGSLDQIAPSQTLQTGGDDCSAYTSYSPDTTHLDHTPVKYIRVNVHFMNSSDSSKNYNYHRARPFGEKLIAAANQHLTDNQKMALPRGNTTPILPTRYQYKISTSTGYEENRGIYCHYDDDLYWFVSRGRNKNNYDRHVIKKYSIGLDSIINIFVVPHHPDSVVSESYAVTSAGIALGNAIKIAGVFETRKSARAFRGLLNHEVGHVLGLRHTWNANDGCDDTPRNPNCWMTTDQAPCDTAASNNLMDYNKHQNAWTPCQIGKIQFNMSRESSRARRVLDPLWCQLDPKKTITIRDSIVWSGAKDLEGNLEIEEGGVLTVNCRLSIPPHGEITVAPGGKLLLRDALVHNACGKTWNGIKVLTRGKHAGQVRQSGNTVIENVVVADQVMSQ